MSVNRRTQAGRDRDPDHRRPAQAPARERRSQAQRRQHTRQALLDAALVQMDAGVGFDALSIRSVARRADGVLSPL